MYNICYCCNAPKHIDINSMVIIKFPSEDSQILGTARSYIYQRDASASVYPTTSWCYTDSAGEKEKCDVKGKSKFNDAVFYENYLHGTFIIHRHCPLCDGDYVELYYRRKTAITGFDPYENFIINWKSHNPQTQNLLGTDFHMYKNLPNAIIGDPNSNWSCQLDPGKSPSLRGFPSGCKKNGQPWINKNSNTIDSMTHPDL